MSSLSRLDGSSLKTYEQQGRRQLFLRVRHQSHRRHRRLPRRHCQSSSQFCTETKKRSIKNIEKD